MSGRRSILLPNRDKSTTRRFDDVGADVVGNVGRRCEEEVDGVTNATGDDDDDDGADADAASGEKMMSPAWTETARASRVRICMRFIIVFILVNAVC